jgi:hypothetical protein
MSAAALSPVSELCQYVGTFAARCKASRWYGAVFHVEVCRVIVANAVTQQRHIAARAYTAEQADHEAVRIMEEVLEDGRVTPSEIKRLRLAQRHIRNSEKADASIVELAEV